MIIMPVKEGENIERALKKFKRKYERTGVLKELRLQVLNAVLGTALGDLVHTSFHSFKLNHSSSPPYSCLGLT